MDQTELREERPAIAGFAFWPLWYGLFMIVQVANVALGMRAVERLASIAAPAILAIAI